MRSRGLPVLDQRQPDDSTVGSGHVSASDVFERGNKTAHKGSIPGEAAIRGVDEPRHWPTFGLPSPPKDFEVDDIVRDQDSPFAQGGFKHIMVVKGSKSGLGGGGLAVDAAGDEGCGNER